MYSQGGGIEQEKGDGVKGGGGRCETDRESGWEREKASERENFK